MTRIPEASGEAKRWRSRQVLRRSVHFAMAKRKRGRPRVEYLLRSVEVRAVRTHMSLRMEDAHGANPRMGGGCWMELRGVFDEPVRGQSEVAISLREDESDDVGAARPAVVGYVVQMRPECRVVVSVPPKQFDRAWALAAGGQLTHAWLSLTKPRYNDAAVPSVSFANHPIE